MIPGMSKLKPNSSFSIASSTSISILPSRDFNSHRLNSAEFLHLLLDEHESSDLEKQGSFFKKRSDEDLDTIREYDFIEENIGTLRPEPCIFCMNCLENVEIDLIDAHSLECTKPEETYEKVVEKVKTFLNWVRDLKVECKDCYLLPLILLEETARKVLEDRNELFGCFEKINSVVRDFNEFPFILLAAQRLSLICEALIGGNKEIIVEPPPRIQIEFIDSTLQISKAPDSFISAFSDISVEFSKGRSSPAESPEALEKYFYSQCIKMRLKDGANKMISMFDLYQKCLEKGLPVEEWKQFIYEAYFNKQST